MQRFAGRWALLAAGLVGYIAGAWNANVAHAAKDPTGELLQLDRDFDAATAREGVDGWVSYFAPDGIMMPAGRDIIVGQPAIRDFMSTALSTSGLSMRWEPMEAAASGDLGYTYGVSKVIRPGPNGTPSVSYGKYVTIWHRQRNKSWKIVVDIGNSSPVPAKSPQ